MQPLLSSAQLPSTSRSSRSHGRLTSSVATARPACSPTDSESKMHSRPGSRRSRAPPFTFDDPDFNICRCDPERGLPLESNHGTAFYAVWTREQQDDS